jgi:hypothetical protein
VHGGAAGLIAGATAYSWIAAGFHPFTWPMRLATAVPIVLVLALGWRGPNRDRAEPRRRTHRVGLWVWAALLVLLMVWELIAYLGSPRHDHPTLSSIAETVMSTQATRALVFAAWLGVGAVLLGRPARVRT